jgi:uncharacterized protein YaaQ
VAKNKAPSVIIQEVSAQREIAEMQLDRLRTIARERLLTYEETKIFDLLTKNLLLDQGNATNTISVESRRLEDIKSVSEETLMQIAQTVDQALVNRSLDTVDDDGSSSK